MAAIPTSELFEEAKCYLCLGITIAEALELALLARVAGGSSSGSPSNPIVVDNINMDLNFDYAHGLGAVPSNVRMVYRVTVATAGYAVNQEISKESVFDIASAQGQPTFAMSSTSTLVSFSNSGAFALGNGSVEQEGGSGLATADSSWLVGKLYIWR